MPTYEYRCAKCSRHFDVYQSFTESPLTAHEGCGGKLTKVLSPAGIVLKGSGFYKTDSRSAPKRPTAAEKSPDAGTEKRSSESGAPSGGGTAAKSESPSGSSSEAKSA